MARRLLTAALTGLLLAGPAAADPGHHHGPGPGPGAGPGWRGDIQRFHERDIERWHGGRWQHGYHGSRLGWWWVVGGLWYYYPFRVDPYPDPYLPPAVSAPQPAPVAPPQYWYYCGNPIGYYPYVARCWGPWKRVPATPVGPAR